ncbi:hypothetical protein PAEVO_00360 [Paenibacillus sp. GM2FR]|jgi:hypothetical protein|uniref:hypothetical protein n=1 Tax=Paenibacillus TaxID=44249 RepID=UPI000C2786FD|nr:MULTISPECIES: hypothetical protein [Paenibacillus]MEC0258534.1 hypothetical protein [Paenibacillus lautus]MEC0306010.1 hypothetical protein [Paenibacillus lautus]PJN53319.1 hypothetical protein PAEVO_00360 [Paenibacillus sp. GM2FR]
MTTRKKSKRNLSNGAINMGISLLGLYTHVNHNNLLKEIFGPEYLDDERLAINLLYAILILQFLVGLYAFTRSSIILYEYKQGIRNEEEDEVSL